MQENNTGKKVAEAFRSICLTLTVLFTALRACGVNDWNWYWVVSPLFVYYTVQIIALLFLGLVKVGETTKGNKSNENYHKS